MNDDKKYEIRFYILMSVLVLSVLMGVFLVFKKQKTAAGDLQGTAAFGFFRQDRFLPGSKGVVVVDVSGIIQFAESANMWGMPDYGVDQLIDRIEKYSQNDKIKGMVLRINSPGGTIGAVQELYNAVENFRKTGKYTVASMGDMAASGGYYIASACHEIMANPGTITGSIGVIISTVSLQDLFRKIGLSQNIFKSGKHKDILSPYRDVTAEERKIIQSVVDDAYRQFYAVVKKSRKIDDSLLKTYADGRIFTGAQAKKLKMIDRLGDLSDAIRVLGTNTGLGPHPPILKERLHPLERIFSGLRNSRESTAERMLHLYTKHNTGIFYLYLP